MCTLDAVPAATLLLPSFEADISDYDGDGTADCDGIDTLFTINNASSSPTLAHVTLWTDWSFPTVDFDVYLTGYDVQEVSLCRAIGQGSLPVTADVQNDPDDTFSPHGGLFSDNPDWDASFPNCSGVFPFPDPILVGGLLHRIQNGHSGFLIPSINSCVGEQLNNPGDCVGGSCPAGTIARGYVTVDAVNECSTVFPNEPGYFVSGGFGIASNRNQLWGDWLKIDPGNDLAQGDLLVHIEASNGFNSGSTPTGQTFYGRYVTGLGGFSGGDNREPLGTSWGTRYLNGRAATPGTTLTVWRDSTADQINNNAGWPCGRCSQGAGPDWCPLATTQVVCWDTQENAVELCTGPDGSPGTGTDTECFPLGTNTVAVGNGLLQLPWEGGWCFLNLDHDCESCDRIGELTERGPGLVAQSWVGALHFLDGSSRPAASALEAASTRSRLSAGFAAVPFSGACEVSIPVIDVVSER